MSRGRAMVAAVFLALSAPQISAADIDPDAMNRIGIRYATGSGGLQDFVAALAWYRRAADAQDAYRL